MHPPVKLSTNHRRTHVPRLVRLRSNTDMTTVTIDGPLRSSSTSLPCTRSLRTASEGGGGGGGGGGRSSTGPMETLL